MISAIWAKKVFKNNGDADIFLDQINTINENVEKDV